MKSDSNQAHFNICKLRRGPAQYFDLVELGIRLLQALVVI